MPVACNDNLALFNDYNWVVLLVLMELFTYLLLTVGKIEFY